MSLHHDPLELHTLAQVSQLTKRSRSSLKRDIAAGRLRIVHLGSSVRVPRVEVERYVFGNGGAATVPCDDINAPAAVERPGAGTGGSSSHAPDTFTHRVEP